MVSYRIKLEEKSLNIFQPAYLGKCQLNNRIIRSATFEGMCNAEGCPTKEYIDFYSSIARNGVGGIITGFAYVSPEGKAMQPGQAGMDCKKKIESFRYVTKRVHQLGCKIFMQLAHTGRQTRMQDTGYDVLGVSGKKSLYFRDFPRKMSKEQIYGIIDKFVQSAKYAKKAGFDGVQLHAAHGYLIHQFILPSINNRKDEFGIDSKTKIGTRFLELIIDGVRKNCGEDFVLLIKVSGSDDYINKFSAAQFKNLIYFLDCKRVDAIEISYGTMDNALNIFRGDIPLKVILKNNPVFNKHNTLKDILINLYVLSYMKMKVKSFAPMYNIKYAQIAKELTNIPVISVGGFRKGEEIKQCLDEKNCDFVSLCRPFICEPDFVKKTIKDNKYVSQCINCNLCAVMCDTNKKTQCYRRKKK